MTSDSKNVRLTPMSGREHLTDVLIELMDRFVKNIDDVTESVFGLNAESNAINSLLSHLKALERGGADKTNEDLIDQFSDLQATLLMIARDFEFLVCEVLSIQADACGPETLPGLRVARDWAPQTPE